MREVLKRKKLRNTFAPYGQAFRTIFVEIQEKASFHKLLHVSPSEELWRTYHVFPEISVILTTL